MLLSRWISVAWQRPEFEFVQQGFGDYVLSGRFPLAYLLQTSPFRDDPRLADRFGFWDREQAARVLGVSDRVFARLVRIKQLLGCRLPAVDPYRWWLFDREKVLALEQRWDEEGLSLTDASRWLGLPGCLVVQLAQFVSSDIKAVRQRQDASAGGIALKKR